MTAHLRRKTQITAVNVHRLSLCPAYSAAVCAEALPVVYAARLGRQAVVSGTVVAAAALGAVVGGRVARRKPLLTLRGGLALAAVGALAADAPSRSIAGTLLVGFGVGAAQPSALGLGSARAPQQRRGMTLGWFGASASAGLALAGALGSTVRADMGFALAATLCIATALAIRGPVSLTGCAAPSRPRAPVAARGLALLSGALRYGAVCSLPALATAHWGATPSRVATIFTFGALSALALKVAVTFASDHWPPHRIVRATGAALLMVSLTTALARSDALGFGAGVALVGLATASLSLANLHAVGFAPADRVDPAHVGDARALQLISGLATLTVLLAAPIEVAGVLLVALSLPLLFYPRSPRHASALLS